MVDYNSKCKINQDVSVYLSRADSDLITSSLPVCPVPSPPSIFPAVSQPSIVLRSSGVRRLIAGDKFPSFGSRLQDQSGKNLFVEDLLPPKQMAPTTSAGKHFKSSNTNYKSKFTTSSRSKIQTTHIIHVLI